MNQVGENGEMVTIWFTKTRRKTMSKCLLKRGSEVIYWSSEEGKMAFK